jgi:Protein of unknown function (DUF3168)
VNPSIELQKAIYTKLSQGIYPVYDYLPASPEYPHVVIGEEAMIDASTKTHDRTSHMVTIHCWSNYRGSREIKEINRFVVESLTEETLILTGFTVDIVQIDRTQVLKELDEGNLIFHGVIQLVFNLTEL